MEIKSYVKWKTPFLWVCILVLENKEHQRLLAGFLGEYGCEETDE